MSMSQGWGTLFAVRHSGVGEVPVDEARSLLAKLLVDLEENSQDDELRLQAIVTANRLALLHGDPTLADVAEALAAEVNDGAPESEVQFSNQRALARATRRAIALAHGRRFPSPYDLAKVLADQPNDVAAEVETLHQGGQPHLARAILEVGLAQHPTHDLLNRLRTELEPTRPVWEAVQSTGESAAQA